MKEILDHIQMEQCDKNTMEYFGVISPVLMERAALCLVEEIEKYLKDKDSGPILIACGTGNNGGDGLAAARMLYLKGYQVDILYPGNEQKASPEGARQLQIVSKYKIPVYKEVPKRKYALVVDSIFGIGLSREISGRYREVIGQLNAMDAGKIAVDISSGVCADNGQILGIAFEAELTVTFGFAKIGHLLYPGAGCSGQVLVRDMGIDRFSLLDIEPYAYSPEPEDIRSFLPRRQAYSNKGSYGKILVVAGSKNMAGAAVLCAKAAYAAGAGLVRVVTPECNREIIQISVPEAILTTYTEETDMGRLADQLLQWADAIAVGPGIGTSETAAALLQQLLDKRRIPLVLDADALNLISRQPELLKKCSGCILTPHLGEMARLTGKPIGDIQKSLIDIALDFAKEYNVIISLKDARTVTASPNGKVWINTSGNNGMSVGGSGDVLTGLLTVLSSGRTDLWMAAGCGSYLHGKAGDLMAEEKGLRGLLASDLVEGIGRLLKLFP